MKNSERSGGENETMQSSQMFDLEESFARMGGDRTLFREVTAMIMEDYRAHADGIHESITLESWDDLKKHTHALRGMVATYSVRNKLIDELQSLEDAADSGDVHRIAVLESQISEELPRFVAGIQNFMEFMDE